LVSDGVFARCHGSIIVCSSGGPIREFRDRPGLEKLAQDFPVLGKIGEGVCIQNGEEGV
jgi:hypothetical protein